MGQSPMQGDLIGLLHATSGRDALGDAGHGNADGSNQLGKIVGRGLALDIGTQCKDHLLGAFPAQALDKLTDPQLFGPYPVERGKPATQRMVSSPEDARSFQRKDVGSRLDNAEFAVCPFLIAAQETLILFGKKPAIAACPEFFPRVADR